MRSINSFHSFIRAMSKEELEATVMKATRPFLRYEAAKWLAKTGELGGHGSKLGRDRYEALAYLREHFPRDEYDSVITVLVGATDPDWRPASLEEMLEEVKAELGLSSLSVPDGSVTTA